MNQAEYQTSRYRDLCEYYAMTPTWKNRSDAHEYGAIESSYGHFKRIIVDALMRSESKNFAGVEGDRHFLTETVVRINILHDLGIPIGMK